MKSKGLIISCLILSLLLSSCKVFHEGESWRMKAKDHTIGLTLSWELSEDKLRSILPSGQEPRIVDGKGILMLFLASTDKYSIGNKEFGKLGVAHLIIPLKNSYISIPATMIEHKQYLSTTLSKADYRVIDGSVELDLKEVDKQIQVNGSIQTKQGYIEFQGITNHIKGKFVDLPNTTLVGNNETKNFLSGPESYTPINFNSITIKQEGNNWIKDLELTDPPKRVWVNVNFDVDFRYNKDALLVKPSN